MARNRSLAATALLFGAALAVVGAAPAKGLPRNARFCGPAACVTISSRAILSGLAPFLYSPANAMSTHPLPSRYLRLRLVPEGGDAFVGWYVPSNRSIELPSYGGGFVAVPRALGGQLAGALRTLRPFSTPRAAAVVLDGRRVVGDSLARELLGRYPAGRLLTTSGRWVGIDLAWVLENPWTLESRLTYHVPSRLLLRPDGGVRLPAGLGARIAKLASR